MDKQLTTLQKINYRIDRKVWTLATQPIYMMSNETDGKELKLLVQVIIDSDNFYRLCALYREIESRINFFDRAMNVVDAMVDVGGYNSSKKGFRKYKALMKIMKEAVFYFTGNHYIWNLVKIVVFVVNKHDAGAIFDKLTNRGNFKNVLKTLGIQPIAVRKDSALSMFVEYWIFKGPEMYSKVREPSVFWDHFLKVFGIDHTWLRSNMISSAYKIHFPAAKQVVVLESSTATAFDDDDEEIDEEVQHVIELQKQMWEKEDAKEVKAVKVKYTALDQDGVAKFIPMLATLRIGITEVIPDMMKAEDLKDFVKRLLNNTIKLCMNYAFTDLLFSYGDVLVGMVQDILESIKSFVLTTSKDGVKAAVEATISDDEAFYQQGGKFEQIGWNLSQQHVNQRKLIISMLPKTFVQCELVEYAKFLRKKYPDISNEEFVNAFAREIDVIYTDLRVAFASSNLAGFWIKSICKVYDQGIYHDDKVFALVARHFSDRRQFDSVVIDEIISKHFVTCFEITIDSFFDGKALAIHKVVYVHGALLIDQISPRQGQMLYKYFMSKYEISDRDIKNFNNTFKLAGDGSLERRTDEVQMESSIAKHTNYMDVFKALKGSEFASLFKAMIMTLKFSVFVNAACGKLGLEGVRDMVVPLFEGFLYESGNLINLTNLWNKLCSEVLPAIYYADPRYITPSFYGDRMSIMYRAVSVGAKMDMDEMRVIICEWKKTNEVENDNIILIFHDVIGEMIAFLEKSINSHSAGGIKNLLSDLHKVHLSLKNKIKYGVRRDEPFCICLYGLPGVGKTTFYPEIMYELKEIFELPTHTTPSGEVVVDEPAVICTTDKFLDNVTNYHKVYILDDLGQNAPDKDTSPNIFTQFMDIQSSVVKPIPKSYVDDKQDNFYNNSVTICTTNFPDCGAKYYVREPEAFARRIHVFVHMVMNNPNDRSAGMKYHVQFLDLERRAKYSRSYITSAEFFVALKDYAILYKAHQKAYQVARTFTFCGTCNNKIRSCTCNQVRIMSSSDLVHGLWFIPSARIKEHNIYQIMSMVVTEEVVMHFWYNSLMNMHFAIGDFVADPAQKMLICMIIREIIEIITTYGRFDYKRFVLLGILCSLPLWVAIVLHGCYNAYSFSPTAEDVRILVESEVDHVVSNAVKTVKNSLTPVWYTQLSLRYMKARDYQKQITNDAVKLLSSSYGFPISLAALGAIIYYFFSEAELTGKVTALGDPPSDDDIQANVNLRSMVAGKYISQLDDKANSYKTGVEIVVRKRAGGLPKAMEKNIVIMETSLPIPMKFYGFWTNGQVYTVYHPLAKFFKLNPDIVFTIAFWFEKTPHEKHYVSITKDNCWTKYTHDIISFPHSVPARNNCPVMFSYECGKNDRFSIRGEVVPLIGKASAFNTSLGVEPAGNILLKYQSKEGLSGTPVFLVERDGMEIQPVMIGVLSAMFEDQPDYAVVSPLVVKSNVTALEMLPELITPDLVKDAFKEYKPIHDGVDPKGVLKHVEDCSNIGEHVGYCDRHVNHSKTAFRKTEFYELAVELIPATADFDFVSLEPKVENGVYQNAILGAARQMAAAGEHVNQSPVWSASVMIADYIWEVIGSQLQHWEPMSVLDALKGTLITNPIKRSTAVGFPFPGMIKDELFVGSYEDPMLVGWYANRMAKIISDMDKGIPPLNVAGSSLKDEILKRGKMTRVFFAGNLDFLILCRIYLGSLMELFMSNRDKLFAQIGMNAIGPEFDKFLRGLFERVHGPIDDMAEFLNKKVWVDSDFEKYDKLVNTLRFAIHIIYWLALKTKFFKTNPVELNRLKLVLCSLMNFVVILGKDVFIFRDKIPSGVWATTMIGCLCEIIIEVLQLYFLIYVYEYGIDAPAVDFVALYRNQYPFFKLVALGNYGDDNLKALSDKVIKFYIHDNIKLFGVWIRMGMTPARKHEKMIEVKSVTDILFLKRVPVYNEHLKRLVGRLELPSIGKMLAFTDSVSPDWKRSVLDQARRELAFHTIELYDKFFEIFKLEYISIETTLSEIDNVVWGSVESVPTIDLS
jgi:hypothetical protein